MNRIDERFSLLAARGEKAFIPYITAGDPSIDGTCRLVLSLEQAGADVIELGIPFSDPIADGSVNQEAALRALRNHVTLHDIVILVKRLREQTQIPIIFFTYYNPVMAYGLEAFASDVAEAGVDGILCVDLPPEESEEYKRLLDAKGVATVYLIAPTSPEDRIRLISSYSTGFLYYVSRTGVTGVRADIDGATQDMVKRIKQASNLPVAVGFGVSTPEQAREIAGYADAVVVGSAIVRMVGQLGDTPVMAERVRSFAEQLAKAIKNKAS